jgi:hypothetical protein
MVPQTEVLPRSLASPAGQTAGLRDSRGFPFRTAEALLCSLIRLENLARLAMPASCLLGSNVTSQHRRLFRQSSDQAVSLVSTCRGGALERARNALSGPGQHQCLCIWTGHSLASALQCTPCRPPWRHHTLISSCQESASTPSGTILRSPCRAAPARTSTLARQHWKQPSMWRKSLAQEKSSGNARRS